MKKDSPKKGATRRFSFFLPLSYRRIQWVLSPAMNIIICNNKKCVRRAKNENWNKEDRQHFRVAFSKFVSLFPNPNQKQLKRYILLQSDYGFAERISYGNQSGWLAHLIQSPDTVLIDSWQTCEMNCLD